MKMRIGGLVVVAMLAIIPVISAQSTAFTYQGRLNDGAIPANGAYDLSFALFDAASGGTQQGNTLTYPATDVSTGLFTVTLDFGNQFPGANRWLEIAVRKNGAGAFATLAPRQALTATPYALYAPSAGSVAGANIVGNIPQASLPADVALRTGGNSFTDTQSINGGALNVNSPGFSTATAIIRARAGDDIPLAVQNSAGGNLLLAKSSGNVGIGTASPNFPLSFASTLGDKISLWGSGGNHLGFGIQPGLLQIHTDLPVNDIVFGHGQSSTMTETVRFKGNGNVGIGATNPAARLEVAGTIKAAAFTGDDSSGGDLKVPGLMRAGSGTGTFLPPDRGLIVRQAKCGFAAPIYIAARTDKIRMVRSVNAFALINDDSPGESIAAFTALTSTGATVNYTISFPANAPASTNRFFQNENIVWIRGSFGTPSISYIGSPVGNFASGHFTEVSFIRTATDETAWVGTITSTYNQ